LNGVQEAAGSTPVTRTKKALTAFAVGAFFIGRVTGVERALRKQSGGLFLARCVVAP